jgi:hypothetical protein
MLPQNYVMKLERTNQKLHRHNYDLLSNTLVAKTLEKSIPAGWASRPACR